MHIVEVNYSCLMDALYIADSDGSRIRMRDMGRLLDFISATDLDLDALQSFAFNELPEPKMAFIDRGLMQGGYAYSVATRRSFVAVPGPTDPRPLAAFAVPGHGAEATDLEFDVALSYSSEDRARVVVELCEALTARGVRVYVLDVATDPQDPIWKIRFREAMFHAHFVVPVLSAHYLARMGTQAELLEAQRLTQEHRSTEAFHPLIPLYDPVELTKATRLTKGDARSGTALDLLWEVMGLPWDLGAERLARFFTSLAKNNRNERDFGFLQELGPRLREVSFGEHDGLPAVLLYFESPGSHRYLFAMGPGGRIRYIGAVLRPKEAERVIDGSAKLQELAEIVRKMSLNSAPPKQTSGAE